jgi:hypothetical protein
MYGMYVLVVPLSSAPGRLTKHLPSARGQGDEIRYRTLRYVWLRSIIRHRQLEGIAFIYVSWCCVFLLHLHPSVIMSQTLHSAVARGLREAGAVLREQGAAEVSDSPLSQSSSVLHAFEEFPNSADVSKKIP